MFKKQFNTNKHNTQLLCFTQTTQKTFFVTQNTKTSSHTIVHKNFVTLTRLIHKTTSYYKLTHNDTQMYTTAHSQMIHKTAKCRNTRFQLTHTQVKLLDYTPRTQLLHTHPRTHKTASHNTTIHTTVSTLPQNQKMLYNPT